MEQDTFFARYQRGEIEFETIDDYIDLWHTSDTKLSLYDFLGISEEQYKLWVENSVRFMAEVEAWIEHDRKKKFLRKNLDD